MSNVTSVEIEDFNKKMAESQTPGKRFPKAIKLAVSSDGKSVTAELEDTTKENLRQLDPWTLAFVHEAQENLLKEVITIINFKVKANTSEKSFRLYFEAFKRRVSFLVINSIGSYFPFKCNVFLDDNPIELYTEQELFNRPQNEIVRPDKLEDRPDNKQGNSLEKDFQTFLYNKGESNKYLVLLGKHFRDIEEKKLPIFREYPTGVFNGQVSDDTRILPTDLIDFISVNKFGCLSLIELKTDDNSPLELISQVLDYALFFACYRKQLLETANLETFKEYIRKEEIACYAVANNFHPYFHSILHRYTNSSKYGFEIYDITMGYMGAHVKIGDN